MKLASAQKTDRGMVSKHNEDFVWVSEESHIYIVADGMGGHEGGEVASRLAATHIGNALSTALTETPAPLSAQVESLLVQSIEATNKAVLSAAQQAKQDLRMGATIVVAWVIDNTAYLSHAGDARAYLIRDDSLSRLTADDSWVAHLVAEGIISEEEGQHSEMGHVITKAIGPDETVDPSFRAIPLQAGDWLLLCSDGLWNMLDDAEILAHFEATPKPETVVKTLVVSANSAGGKDNISVVAVRVG